MLNNYNIDFMKKKILRLLGYREDKLRMQNLKYLKYIRTNTYKYILGRV